MTFTPFTVTTNAPLRGLSELTTTLMPAPLRTASTLAERVLKTPQLLQCSIMASLVEASLEADDLGGEAAAAFETLGAAFATAFFGAIVAQSAFAMW